MTDWEHEYRALREGLEALADELDTFAQSGEISSGIAMGWRAGVKIAAHNVRERLALLAPSPAEGTGEAIHDDGCAEWCNHCEVCGTGTPYGSRCPNHPNAPAPVSSGEAGGGIILLCGSTCGHDHNSLNGPSGCCEHGPYMYFCQQCHDAARPDPMVNPSAEEGKK